MRNANATNLVQFLLDCRVIPEVAALVMEHGDAILAPLYKMTRTFCYSIHMERLKILNRWNYASKGEGSICQNR